MAVKKVGTLIREARTAKGLTQEQLAAQIDGLSASELGKAERGEKELTAAELKAIAKATGVTQKSLLEAPKGGSAAASTAKKTSSTAKSTAAKTSSAASKTATAKKTAASRTSSSAKTTAKTSAANTASAKKTSAETELTSTEKKLLEYYRAAASDSKKLATKILKGEKPELGELLPLITQSGGDGEEGLLAGILGKFMK